MATRGPKIVCEACDQDVRLYSLIENDGLVIGCGCRDVKHSLDAMAYELGVSHLSDDWVVVEDRDDEPDVDDDQRRLLTDGGVEDVESAPHENHPKRRRWDGHVDRLPYETELFDGGEKARLTYRDFDGSQCAVDVEVGEYMSHNSWLLLFDDDGSGDDHIIRADGVVLLQTYPDEEISEIGYAEKVEPIVVTDGGRAEDDSATPQDSPTVREVLVDIYTDPGIYILLVASVVVWAWTINFYLAVGWLVVFTVPRLVFSDRYPYFGGKDV